MSDTEKKMERWRRIAREASKQCGRSRVPSIGPKATSVKEFCFINREADLKLVFWEEEQSVRIGGLPHKSKFKSAAALIGPEGGFSSNEVEGNRSDVYQDSRGNPTAGVGHKLTKRELETYKVGDEVPQDIGKCLLTLQLQCHLPILKMERSGMDSSL